jgi:serpin B
MTRRDLLAAAGVAALAGCGAAAGSAERAATIGMVESRVPRASAPAEAVATASRAVAAFTRDLYLANAGDRGNIVCSPYSVAIALGMTLQGTRGTTATEMLGVLHSPDTAALAAGLGGIDAELARRAGPVRIAGQEQRLDLSAANSLWGQAGIAWRQGFLDGLARQFGTGLRVVDFTSAPEAARAAINSWVAQQTRTRIPELLRPGLVNAKTRLALVNALWFKAPWQFPFEREATSRAPFHLLDGSTTDADLMQLAGAHLGYARGEGWQAVDLPYGRGELAMAVVVPDAGRFAEVERSLGSWLPRILTGLEPVMTSVKLPRWTSRTQILLNDALKSLGMPTAFTDDADFTGMTGDADLAIAAVVHEGFIAIDENGTEAAAATAVLAEEASAPMPQREVVADRPFLYVIHDLPTKTPLFVGRVLTPHS